MPDPVAPPQAAPVQTAPQSSPSTLGSVERLKSMPEPPKPLGKLDDAFADYFKNRVKATPEEAEESYKNKGKEKPEEKEEAESKPERKPEAKETKEETKVEDTKPAAIIDPETLTPSKDIKSKEAQANWKQLNDNSKRINSENKKLSAKVKDLEAVVASKGGSTQKEIETLKAQIDELRPYREMVDIQHDPDFRKSYDEPIEASRKAINKILKDTLQVPQETIDLVDFNNPSSVDKVVAVMEEAGQKTLARRVLAHADEIQKLNEKRGEALGNAKAKFSEFSKTREQQSLTKRTEEEALINQAVQNAYQSKNKEGALEAPEFNTLDFPENATKDQIQEVETHNKRVEVLQGLVQERIQATDPESRALTAVQAVFGRVRDYQLKQTLQELAEVKAELARVSKASSEKRSVSAGKPTNGSNTAVTADESMSNFFANRRR